MPRVHGGYVSTVRVPALDYKPLLNTNHTYGQNYLKKTP